MRTFVRISVIVAGLACSAFGGTVTGTVRELNGVAPNNKLTNFQLRATFGGILVGNGALVNPALGTYSVSIDEELVRRVSQQLTGEINMSVTVSFTADNAIPATLIGVAGTGSSTVDVIMPERKCRACGRCASRRRLRCR